MRYEWNKSDKVFFKGCVVESKHIMKGMKKKLHKQINDLKP